MDWFRPYTKTKLHSGNTRRTLSIYRKLFWTRTLKSHNNTENHHYPKRHKHDKHVLKLISLCLTVGTATASFASDIGGVSATANPVANSSETSDQSGNTSFTRWPYITNTYGNGIQCQGATMNITPFATGNIAVKRPYESYYMDPVYNNVDADNDDVPDNPGQILYYKPTRTGQKDSSTYITKISLQLGQNH